MRQVFATILLSAAFVFVATAQVAEPALGAGPDALRITHGPVIETVNKTGAIIAWSTNINAGTVLHFGIDADHLTQAASMPWGGLTHRVELRNLKPDTRYFFRAESPHGQGTGETAASPVMSFQTVSTP